MTGLAATAPQTTSIKPLAVAVLDDFQNVAKDFARWERLADRATIAFHTDHLRGEALVERLRSYDALVAIRERTPFPRSLLERLPNLKLIVTAGWRNRAIDLAACKDHGILVCGTDAASGPTAELAFGLILSLARQINAEDRALRQGHWQTRLGFALQGKTLGIIGLGRLGGQLAGYGRAFGMNIVAWSENLTPERAAQHGCIRVEKDELLRTSDVISLHLVLSNRTRGIIGKDELARMKPSAFVVNTARAALIDQAALIDALHAGTIAGAGLDVYDEEPLPLDAPIRAAPNTILTPHLGYATKDGYEVYFPQVLEDLEAWISGHPIRLITTEESA